MELYFKFGGEMTVVKIEGHSLSFATAQTNFSQFVPIDRLYLPVSGILKEFPDLEGKEKGEMREIAIQRFKEKINGIESENEIRNYVVKELGKSGYELTLVRQKGWRPKKVDE